MVLQVSMKYSSSVFADPQRSIVSIVLAYLTISDSVLRRLFT